MVTARARALGVDFTTEHRLEAAALRVDEPWFASARDAYGRRLGRHRDRRRLRRGGPVLLRALGHGRRGARRRTRSSRPTRRRRTLYASPGAFDPAAARAALAGWDARVLVLAGERDGGPLPRVAAAVAELLPHAELAVQEGAGHFPWVDDPDRFTRTVASFLG